MFTPTIKLEHADARGEIYSITLPGDQELMLIHSNKGALRGGHAHTTDEVVVMVTGEMRYRKRFPAEWQSNGSDSLRVPEQLEFILHGGNETANWKGVFHMAEFLEDSWLVEIKTNAKKGASQNIDYPAWRERVKANSAG